MGTKLDPKENELYQRVDEVLHYIWDPCGVSDVPQARDEYYGYLPSIFKLVKEKAGAGVIADELNRITGERMGMGSNDAHSCKVADILLAYRKKILGDS